MSDIPIAVFESCWSNFNAQQLACRRAATQALEDTDGAARAAWVKRREPVPARHDAAPDTQATFAYDRHGRMTNFRIESRHSYVCGLGECGGSVFKSFSQLVQLMTLLLEYCGVRTENSRSNRHIAGIRKPWRTQSLLDF